MNLPHFFIVGAAKSGTTSLYHYLKQHPEIFMPERKEPCFFIEWRGGVQSLGEYERLFANATAGQKIGEASTAYLFDTEAPRKIRAMVPEAKVIILLRNPAEVAFSLWRMNRNVLRAGEPLSFREALRAEPERLGAPRFRRRRLWWHGNYYYYNRGLFHAQVERYFANFSRDRVGVWLFEDLKREPENFCREVFSFLGVNPEFRPEIKVHNESEEVHSRLLNWVLTLVPGFRDDSPSKTALRRFNRRPPLQLASDLRAELLEKYREDIGRLGALIGRDLSVWN